MPGEVAQYLDLLDFQREAIFRELEPLPASVLWYRPGPRVWSIGEHLDHTRVHNRSSRWVLPWYFWPASLFARVWRDRPYRADLDDPCQRPNYPKNLGWIWSPKYTPRRPASLACLHEGLRAEHDFHRRFFTRHDERLLGHVVCFDPYLGAFNLVQWLRYLAYHDAHHFERVRVRIGDPEYCRAAEAAKRP